MQWYYLSDSHERIAISDAQFAPLAARGLIRPATPVWRKGMADWAACGEVLPQIFAAGVARDSDQRNPLADSAAVRGTVIGISRTLAGYRVWFRILGVIALLFSLLTTVMCAVLVYFWFSQKPAGGQALTGMVPGLSSGDALMFWIVLLFNLVTAVVGAIAGWSLLRAAGHSWQARESGNEHCLNAAIHSLGRYFVLAVSAILFSVIFWLALWLANGWDKAFPSAPAKSPQSVVL